MDDQAHPSQNADHVHSDSERGYPSGRTLAQPDTQLPPEREAKVARRHGIPQDMRQQVFSWRPESSNIRKWNVTSQPQVRKINHRSPMEVEASGEHATQANSPATFRGLHATSHNVEESSDHSVSSPVGTGSNTPFAREVVPVRIAESRRQQKQTIASTSPSVEVADKNASEDPMSLLFITRSDQPKSVQDETQDLRQIKRRAQQIAMINRKQARQRGSLVGSRRTRPRPSHDSLASKRDSSSLEVLEQQLSSGARLTTMVGPTHGYSAPSVGKSLGSSTWDPFQTGKVTITPHMESVLLHYFTVILPAVEPMQAESEEFKSWAIPITNAKPVMLYAILGCMGQDMEQSSCLALRSPLRSNVVAEYRIKALEFINQGLADNQMAMDPSTLTAVHFLLWQEVRVQYMAMLKLWSLALTGIFYRSSLAMRIFAWMAFKDCCS